MLSTGPGCDAKALLAPLHALLKGVCGYDQMVDLRLHRVMI
jgi:hypothetical protein